ncbi:sulfatase [Halobellus salinus]|nr:sulfatase [Halobellus salinus]SMP12544.1 Arylsulfatase A [Halobellus salinus]
MTQRPNILFVVLDTVRAKSTTFANRDITPIIEAELERGEGYHNAIAPTPWSLSSHASMFTGKYATEHGATPESRWLPEEHITLAERLSEEGYRTGIFTGNLFTSAAFNMSRGFNTTSFSLRKKLFDDGHSLDEVLFREDYPGKRALLMMGVRELLFGDRKTGSNILYAGFNKVLGRTVENVDERKELDDYIVPDAKRFITSKARSERPFFAFVNILSAHAPWEYSKSRLREIGVEPSDYGSDEEWEYLASVSENQWPHAAGELTFDDREQEMLTLLYESYVHRADKLAGELLQALEEADIRDETIVILTSDHGEAIAEDGVLGHTVSLQDACVQVPLVVSGPKSTTTEINEIVSLKNLYGTLLSRAGVQTDAPTLHDTLEQDIALTERFGVPLEGIQKHVDNINDDIKQYTHHHQKLYSSTSSVERCTDTGEVFGDADLSSELSNFTNSLEPHTGENKQARASEKVTDRLEQLGYINSEY